MPGGSGARAEAIILFPPTNICQAELLHPFSCSLISANAHQHPVAVFDELPEPGKFVRGEDQRCLCDLAEGAVEGIFGRVCL